MVSQDLSPEQTRYVERLARRYVRLRKSGSIDEEDLRSAASIRWWQFRVRNPDVMDERLLMACFYQQVKGAMRDVVRDSSPVKVTRTVQSRMEAYQRPYTVEMDHAIDIPVGDSQVDVETWMDVVASLKKLPEREQIILSLYFERDFTFSEIAQVFEVSVSTITRAYKKAIDLIRADLLETSIHAKNQSI